MASPELLSKLDSLLPEKLKEYDAFPKLPTAYKSRSQSRGFLTVFIGFIIALLLLNDISEYVYGWTDFEFGVDSEAVVIGPHSGRASRQGDKSNWMNVNVDLVVNMPCRCTLFICAYYSCEQKLTSEIHRPECRPPRRDRR